MEETVRETVSEGEYCGEQYEIVRTDDELYDNGFEYEFVLFVNGEEVTTAGRLEARGYESPWAASLKQYAEAFIDGMVDGGPY